MAVVKHLGVEYPCSTALKGDDYIRLLNSAGETMIAFEGVTDFTAFSITGGDWAVPTAAKDCYLAIIQDDGSIGKGTHRCCDLPSMEETWTFTLKDGSTVEKKVMLA